MKQKIVWWISLQLLLLAVFGFAAEEQKDEIESFGTGKISVDENVLDLAEQQYQKALDIRQQSNAEGGSGNQKFLEAWKLLVSCSGIKIHNSSFDASWISTDNLTLDGFRGVQFSHYPPHANALCEMATAMERGEGVAKNTFLGFSLLNKAGELGSSKCQGEYGFRLSLGIRPDKQGKNIVGQIVEGDIQQALMMYFLGASGNDSLSNLAMGYRHMEGLAVPQSCFSAVFYLDPAAAKVIEVAGRPEGLARYEKPRLSYRAQNDFRSPKDTEVLQYYQNTADLGNVQHQNIVGELYFTGSFGNKDWATAYRYFLKAARAGDSDAMANLGHMYANGLGVTPSNESALYWFQRSADNSNYDGYYGLGYMYLNGYGVTKNYTTALRSFRKAAEGKHIEAYYHLGVMSTKGWGMKQPSDQQALRYFSMAAQNGHTTAAYNAALMQASGRGGAPNCEVALQSFRKIINRGPWMELFEVAYDKFMKRNYDDALLLYLRGSEMGLELASSNAAWMIERGLGIDSSQPTAMQLMIKLNRRAVELGNWQGLLAMGDTFFYGNGVQQDLKQAAHLYRQAADHKSVTALFNLGFMHHFGSGLPMDTHLAKRYYDQAMREEKKARLPVVPFLILIHIQNWWKDVREIFPVNFREYVEILAFRVSQMAKPVPGSHVMLTTPAQGGIQYILNIGWIERGMTLIFNRLEQILYSKNTQSNDQNSPSEDDTTPTTNTSSSTDTFESVIIVVLVLVLLGVLQRRRATRNQQQQDTNSQQEQQQQVPQTDYQQQQQQQQYPQVELENSTEFQQQQGDSSTYTYSEQVSSSQYDSTTTTTTTSQQQQQSSSEQDTQQ